MIVLVQIISAHKQRVPRSHFRDLDTRHFAVFYFALAGGIIPFMRKYSIICP